MCMAGTTASMAAQEQLKTMPDYGNRPNGTKKGKGFLGEVKRPDGTVMTEVTTKMNVDGKDLEFPLITKNSTKEDLEYLKKADLKSTDFIKNAPAGMVDRAITHAMNRKKAGLPVYAD
mgnify:CR=1 FL=1